MFSEMKPRGPAVLFAFPSDDGAEDGGNHDAVHME
jgi:hypothetical protein